jgi:hypothetical protein
MLLLQCGSKNVMEKKFKSCSNRASKNKSVKSTQFEDPLGTACGPLVDKHRSYGMYASRMLSLLFFIIDWP